MIDQITIRPITENDLEAVLDLVKELAVYEHALEEVHINLNDYIRDWKSGLFESIVAVKNNQVIGMCLYYMAYSSWKGSMLYLDDFVVTPDNRGEGVGKLLFDEILNIGKERNVSLLKWQILDWNKPALNFYAKYQAVIEKEWWNGKIVL